MGSTGLVVMAILFVAVYGTSSLGGNTAATGESQLQSVLGEQSVLEVVPSSGSPESSYNPNLQGQLDWAPSDRNVTSQQLQPNAKLKDFPEN